MLINTLDRLVLLQSPQDIRDPLYGSPVPTWITYDQAWAGITETAQGENTEQERRVVTASAVIRLRWRTDLLPTHRIVDDMGRAWLITGITASGKRREAIDCACQYHGHAAGLSQGIWLDHLAWDDAQLWAA